MKWFKECQTIEAVKRMYKQLCRQYHPDLHPGEDTTETMQEINAEYDVVFDRLKNIHETADGEPGKTYTKETVEVPEAFRSIIESLIHCDGLTIDLVGSWIWLTGETYAHKDLIKSLGFKWAKNKKAWYWRAEENASHNRKKMTLDEIKNLHGCETFKATARVAIA